jgi:F-type H+-transporting ATPase subunit b
MRFPRVLTVTVLLVCAGAVPLSASEGGHAVVEVGAKLLNFAILVGALAYFLRGPIAAHLASRSEQIRQDLVTAAEMRAAATAQLAEIDQKMRALPGELEALKRQGAEDVKAEQVRIAETAVAERARLLDQTRREIDMRMRVARRELTEHAAALAVGVAEQRIRRAITADDQIRLVDRYASQLSATGSSSSRGTR